MPEIQSISSAYQNMSSVQAVFLLLATKIITLEAVSTHIFHISCGRLDHFGQIIT